MALSAIITPVAVLLEMVICVLGIYAGFAKKKTYGYLFGVTFLLFALFDYLGQIGLDPETLSLVNIVAVLAALIGIYMVVQEK